MIYWYTGQPGHGKTLHGIDRLLEFKDQGRAVYACNIREFDYARAGVLEMTPEQFRDFIASENARWTQLIQQKQIKVQ